VGPRTGLHDVEKRKILPLQALELRLSGRPAPSQLLYRLRYSGSEKKKKKGGKKENERIDVWMGK
jgi:hypothetical protein